MIGFIGTVFPAIEDEYYVRVEHDMTKQHYISFIAALSPDKIEIVKLYPEGNAQARIKINGVRKILFYCNKDGLFSAGVVKGIDDRQTHMMIRKSVKN